MKAWETRAQANFWLSGQEKQAKNQTKTRHTPHKDTARTPPSGLFVSFWFSSGVESGLVLKHFNSVTALPTTLCVFLSLLSSGVCCVCAGDIIVHTGLRSVSNDSTLFKVGLGTVASLAQWLQSRKVNNRQTELL